MGSTWETCLRAGILWDLVYIPANLLSIPSIPLSSNCIVVIVCSQAVCACALVSKHCFVGVHVI